MKLELFRSIIKLLYAVQLERIKTFSAFCQEYYISLHISTQDIRLVFTKDVSAKLVENLLAWIT